MGKMISFKRPDGQDVPLYDPAAAELAWRRTPGFLGKRLR